MSSVWSPQRSPLRACRCISLHPGCVATEVTRYLPLYIRLAYAASMPVRPAGRPSGLRRSHQVMWLLQKTVGMGARTTIHACLAPDLAPPSDAAVYLEDCQIIAVRTPDASAIDDLDSRAGRDWPRSRLLRRAGSSTLGCFCRLCEPKRRAIRRCTRRGPVPKMTTGARVTSIHGVSHTPQLGRWRRSRSRSAASMTREALAM